MLEETQRAFVAGQWITGKKYFPVLNPFDGSLVANVPNLEIKDLERAIDSAVRAQTSWAQKNPQERNRILLNWAASIREQRDSLAELLCQEQGKILKHAYHEIDYASACLEHVSRIASEYSWRKTSTSGFRVEKVPVGVVAAITPWNFPCAAIMIKAASALAAGATILVKPSEETPLIALALSKLAQNAGLPEGCLHILPTLHAQEFGSALGAHPQVRMLSFTGSTAVGKKLYQSCSSTIKKMSLELGGNAPFIVFADAPFEKAIEGVLNTKTYSNGQICLGSNRIFIERDLYESFIEAFAARAQELKLGSPRLQDSQLCPLINAQATQKLEQLTRQAMQQGAQLISGGRSAGTPPQLFPLTVLKDCHREMGVYHEEIFGPLACFYPFDSKDPLIDWANETDHGLAAYVYTGDPERALTYARKLDCGMVGINTTDIASLEVPFGGVKSSGLGREGGPEALDEYLESKVIKIQ